MLILIQIKLELGLYMFVYSHVYCFSSNASLLFASMYVVYSCKDAGVVIQQNFNKTAPN